VSNPGSLSERGSRSRGGVGLDNVRRRLAELYPGRHELCLEERDGTVFARLTLRVR
jgi:LytS/YehU family sensor histidine kinase